MYPNNFFLKSLSLESVIDRHPLVVHPDMPLVEAILMMSQGINSECLLPNLALSQEATISLASTLQLDPTQTVDEKCEAETSEQLNLLRRMDKAHSSVLVVENERLVGIFTERDLVRLTATQTTLGGMSVSEVMTRQLHTLVLSAEQTVISALNVLKQFKIRHLPVLDTHGVLLGIITPDHIRQILQPTDLLKFRSVGEGMTAIVIHTIADTNILQISQLMVEHGISSIVIVDEEQPLRPVGIVTEKDIVQFQVLELDLAQLKAGSVMSSPLFCLQPENSLWSAQQVMESRRIRRLVVTGAQGELQGIVTQSDLLKSFDPLEMLQVVDSLQVQLIDQTKELEQTNEELRAEVTRRQRVEDDLKQANQSLEERVAARTTELALLNEELQAKMLEQQSCDIALEVSQQGISDFMENALIGMHWIDREGIIVWANQAELEMLGYDRTEYLGQPLVNFHIDKETIKDIHQRLLNNEPVTGREAQMWRKGGEICHVSIDANAFFKDGKFIHARCFTRDITDQKNAEVALQQTLNSLELEKYALDQSAIVAITDQHGKIVYINDKFSQISQYSATELLGKTHAVINSGYHPPEFFRDLWATISSGQVWSGEIRNRAKDGSYYWVTTTIVPFLDECSQPFQYLSIRFDITDRKRIEIELQASRSRYRALLTTAPVGIFQTDVVGNIIFLNQQCLELMGVPLAEALGEGWADSLHPDDRARVSTQWYEAVQANREFSTEHRLMTPQGRVNWVFVKAIGIHDEAGILTGYIGTLTDITERKQSERMQKRFLHLGSDLQVIANRNGYFQWVSPTFESILGWTTAEMTSRPWIEFVHPDNINLTIAEETSLFDGKETIGFENRYRHKDGSYRWLSWKAKSCPEEQLIYAVAVDITEKKQLEQQFLRAQRLESLGTLASGIAHNLNNVLTPIQGVAQLLPRTLPNLDERNQRLLTMLVESSKRGSSLVKQILTFARGIDGQSTLIQARHILAEIINVARQTFPKSIEIILDIGTEDLWMVNVDATQIHQVLMNLFVNARDAMPNGGTITTTAQNLVIDETYAKMQSNARAGSYIVITIADTGMGIDPETINKIFDPFFTTKETGTGLGLSTVSGIIKAHDGFINVYSEIDRGTYFKIYLPAVNNSEEEQPPVRPQFLEGNGQLILVVDDEASVREISKSSLETYNYRVMLANGGVEGIAQYAQHLDEISAVMLDMMMPNLDTPSVIRALQCINPAVKIIVMSGSAANEHIVEQFGLAAFLTKPFTMTEVLNTLSNLNQPG
jgi:PAS domain S-box-containing protein